MAAQGRQEPQRRLERQGPSLLQRSQSGETGAESTSTRGRPKAKLFLRPYGRDEKEAHERQDRKRSQFED